MGGSAEYRAAHRGFEHTGLLDGHDSGKDVVHFPAEANVRIKAKTTDGALAEFRKQHIDSDHEWAYVIDDFGYVHEYHEGGSGSVYPGDAQGGHVIHNHPSHGEPAFSYADLANFVDGEAKSVTASSKNYDYTVERGTHFKAQEFKDALSTAKLRGADYSDALHLWLLNNAWKYGYKYTRNVYNNDGKLVRTTKSSTKIRKKGKK